MGLLWAPGALNDILRWPGMHQGETWADEYPLRFGRGTAMASDGRRVIVATNETAEIVEFGPQCMVRRVRTARTPRAVTADSIVPLQQIAAF